MKRIPQTPRKDWADQLEQVGFHFHSIDEHGNDANLLARASGRFRYWREDIAYAFTEAQIETLYEASMEAHAMCLDLVERVIRKGDLDRLAIPAAIQDAVAQSWKARAPSLYGRFDFSWTGEGSPKLLEYNADTPTSLIESSVAQWFWKEQVQPSADQFNSIHEALIERWKLLAAHHGKRRLHLAGMLDCQEDVGNLEYLMDTALQAGLACSLIGMEDIGVTPDNQFVGPEGEGLELVFKLYPWEFMALEAPAEHLPTARATWIEPLWKMVLSNKALLALLWEAHPGHPLLLETRFQPEGFAGRRCVKKPLLSREGANVSFLDNGQATLSVEGAYGEEGFIYQEYAPVARFDADEPGMPREVHAVLGAWMVGDEAVGLCVREDASPITRNTSYFVPHFFR